MRSCIVSHWQEHLPSHSVEGAEGFSFKWYLKDTDWRVDDAAHLWDGPRLLCELFLKKESSLSASDTEALSSSEKELPSKGKQRWVAVMV